MRLALALRLPGAGPEPAVGCGSHTHPGSPGGHAAFRSYAWLVALYRDQRCGGRLEGRPRRLVRVPGHRALWVGTESLSGVDLYFGGVDHVYALDRRTRTLPHAGGNGAGRLDLETFTPGGRGTRRPDDHSRNPGSGNRLSGDRLCR